MYSSIRSALLSLGIFAVLGSCQKRAPEESIKAFALSETMMEKCEFHEAALSYVKNEIRLFGKITANNNKEAQINPIVSGVVKTINVGLGDYVRQGQVLATIQSSEVASFRKEKMDAINNLTIAEKNMQVARDLFEGKLNSEKDVAAAESELEKAKAELERMNEVYAIYRLRSGSLYQVQAPISGFVITKNITINEQLRLDQAEPLFTVAEIDEIWAVANVNESDIAKISESQDVVVHTLAFPDFHYKGKIEKIYNVIDPETRAMKIRVKIPNSDYKLKPEMNCTVDVHFTEDKELVTVPASAVIFDKSKHWVMVFRDKHNIETREVQLYRELGKETYIQSGLSPGETVISENGILVYDALND